MMSLAERRGRAAERVVEQKVRPIALADGSYIVASSRVPGRGYRVSVDAQDGLLSCSCPAGSWDFPCKHVEAVRLLRGGDRETLPLAS